MVSEGEVMRELKQHQLRYLLLLVGLICLSGWITTRPATNTASTNSNDNSASSLYHQSSQYPDDGQAMTLPLTSADGATQQRINSNYGKLPMSFEANYGQTNAQVKFISRRPGYR